VAQGVASVEIFSAVSDEVARLFGSDISAIVRFERDGTAAVMGVHGVTIALTVRQVQNGSSVQVAFPPSYVYQPGGGILQTVGRAGPPACRSLRRVPRGCQAITG
jgi:hypothetical protein